MPNQTNTSPPSGIASKVITIISAVARLSPDVVTPSQELRTDLQMDDIALLDLETSIEDEFSIILEQFASDEWKTVQDVVTYLEGMGLS